MNDSQFAAYEVRCATAARLKSEILPHNKQVLFDALIAAGIAVVTVGFDGCGDSGQFEAPSAFAANNESREVPNTPITVRCVDFENGLVTETETSAREYIERTRTQRSGLMAEFYTQFSCILDVGPAENATRAEHVRAEFATELHREEGGSLGFAMEVQTEIGPGSLWLYSDEQGEPEHVIGFVLRCAEALNLAGVWGFSWSHSCSKPRVDAFGGGAHVLDLGARRSIADIDCSNFVHEQIARVPVEAVGDRS